MRLSLSRRLFVGGLVGAACIGAAPAGAALSVGCWPGLYADTLRDLVDAHSTIPVQQIRSLEAVRVAALLSTAAVPLDVAMLSDTDAYRLSLSQMFLPVTTAGVAALPQIIPSLRTPYGVPQARTALTIAYNAHKLSTPPRGFDSLFEAARRGEAGFSSEIAIHNLAAGAISQHRSQASLTAAKTLFAALKKAGTLRIFPTNELLGQALAAGTITMAPMWRSRAYVWRKEGRDIADAVPAEGAVPFTVIGCIPKHARHPEDAMRYLETLLDRDTQAEMASRTGLLPTVSTVTLQSELLDKIGFSMLQQSRFRPLLLSAVARNGLALRQFWDHDLA